MIIELHTPNGITEIDSDTVTDAKLAEFNMTRESLKRLVTNLTPRDLATEIDEIKATLEEMKPAKPLLSTHISTIDAIDTAKARPVRIKRTWEGKDYFYDCFATESVKDQYLAGDVAVGDYVIVHFDDIGEQIVTEKVFKSW